MKTPAITLCTLAALAICASCDGNKKDVSMQYQLTVSVDARNVVKNLKSVDNTDYFPDGTVPDKDYHPRISLFIYKEDGTLAAKEVQIVDDFYQKVEVKTGLDKGTYTLVASADIVENSGDNVTFEFWGFKNTGGLQNFRITDLGYVGYQYKALGVSKKTVDIAKSETLSITVEPAGALVTLYFYNLSLSKMAYVVYGWDKDADYYSVDDEAPNITNIDISNVYEVNSEYTGMYGSHYFLPVQNMELIWGTLTAAEKVVNAGSKVINVTKGVNQTLSVDVQSASMQLKSAPLPAAGRIHNLREQTPATRQQSLHPKNLR
jgi:hypothetical protein